MKQHEQWGSRLGFILAAAGSAIGLGALWKFPYMTGTNGGGIFLIVFLLFTLLIGAPMLLAEFIIGRHTQKDAISAYKVIAPKKAWQGIGYLGVVTSFLLLSFYSVIGGWVLTYFIRSLSGGLTGLSNEAYGELFVSVIGNPIEATLAQAGFLILTIAIVQFGVHRGIETASKYMMPALFILFIILVIRSLTLEGAWEGVVFFLKPNIHALTPGAILDALGQSFFALSVGVSIMVTYSSYLSKEDNLPGSVFSIVGMNIFISLLAGLAIFPAVFAFGFEPSGDPGLIFTVLPAVFSKMAFGSLFFTIFLALLLFATLTSAFSMLEIIVASITKDETSNRKKVSWLSGGLVFLFGIPLTLSFGLLGDLTIFGKTLFVATDFLVSNLLLPVGSFLIALFVSVKISKTVLQKEVSISSPTGAALFPLWYFLIRFIVPIAIIIVFLYILGIIKV
ncbi:sodium-dependent transporter [Pseudalkalibacillus caeni]|uniref:Transporter n=1 Tax=Exobacillus caeni TaxID=2574798 RepID=A0A5R9F9G3_9BACL|nr:sodium-dependent transporter [Pseudalkalibacillus caeni]TLS38880.1 sodium-dependent transporter [Pseudalkalibacillus caeni]